MPRVRVKAKARTSKAKAPAAKKRAARRSLTPDDLPFEFEVVQGDRGLTFEQLIALVGTIGVPLLIAALGIWQSRQPNYIVEQLCRRKLSSFAGRLP